MGVSGEMVIDTMVNRLERTLTDAKSSYNWIIILGGRYNRLTVSACIFPDSLILLFQEPMMWGLVQTQTNCWLPSARCTTEREQLVPGQLS